MRRILYGAVVLTLTIMIVIPAGARPQLRGKKLYDEWSKLEMTKTTGTTARHLASRRNGMARNGSRQGDGRHRLL